MDSSEAFSGIGIKIDDIIRQNYMTQHLLPQLQVSFVASFTYIPYLNKKNKLIEMVRRYIIYLHNNYLQQMKMECVYKLSQASS